MKQEIRKATKLKEQNKEEWAFCSGCDECLPIDLLIIDCGAYKCGRCLSEAEGEND